MSKIHQLLRRSMQTLCPPSRRPAMPESAGAGMRALPRLGAGLLALGLALGLAEGRAATAAPDRPAAAATAATAAAPALRWPASAASPEQALAQVVAQWLGASQGLDPAGVRLMPLDPRLQIRPCQAGLNLELPFASRETVRVRCDTPAWQLFVRVQPDSPALAGATAQGAQGAQAAPGGAAAPPQAATRQVVVAAGLLPRGSRLGAEQLTLAELPAQNLPANVIERVADALNSEVLRDLPAGTPLRSQDLRPALMVRRGQIVMLSVGARSGFRVVARLEALQDGRMGEQIRLKNTESGRIVSAVVTGLNTADAL